MLFTFPGWGLGPFTRCIQALTWLRFIAKKLLRKFYLFLLPKEHIAATVAFGCSQQSDKCFDHRPTFLRLANSGLSQCRRLDRLRDQRYYRSSCRQTNYPRGKNKCVRISILYNVPSKCKFLKMNYYVHKFCSSFLLNCIVTRVRLDLSQGNPTTRAPWHVAVW